MLCVDPIKRLTAEQVLAHSWLEVPSSSTEESHEHNTPCSSHLEARGGSFSVSIITRDQDISFGTRSPALIEPQSPTFTCRSSFSAFLAEPSTPDFTRGGFSFHSPIPSMPSFTFFSPIAAPELLGDDLSADLRSNPEGSNAILSGESEFELEKRFTSPDFSTSPNDMRDLKQKPIDSKRNGAGAVRVLGIHNKRNRTIGLGEFDQLDIVVTESVIRWVSCTHLPTASSLRSSLVC